MFVSSEVCEINCILFHPNFRLVVLIHSCYWQLLTVVWISNKQLVLSTRQQSSQLLSNVLMKMWWSLAGASAFFHSCENVRRHFHYQKGGAAGSIEVSPTGTPHDHSNCAFAFPWHAFVKSCATNSCDIVFLWGFFGFTTVSFQAAVKKLGVFQPYSLFVIVKCFYSLACTFKVFFLFFVAKICNLHCTFY